MKKITFLAFLLATLSSNAQVLSEDFSSGAQGSTWPNGWSTSGSNGNWVVGSTTNTGVPDYGGGAGMVSGGCDGLYALLDSDGLGGGSSQNASLVSPVMDLTGYTNLIVKFNHHFRVYTANAEYGYVEGTIDGGTTWENITTFTGPSEYTTEGLVGFDISTLAGNPAVQIRFRYVGSWGYYWGIDNIEVIDEQPPQTVFERLQGNVYQQIETPADCGSCEEEINYYMFSAEGLRIIGTDYDGVCEQDDFQPIGDCDDCAYIETNTTEEFEVCIGDFFPACQTITFTSEDDDEIQFDFPLAGEIWTAQLYEGEVPCLPTSGLDDNEFNNVKMFPNPANGYLNFTTNSHENIDIQIFDMLGKSVLRLENVRNSVDISELKSGVYFVQIVLGTEKSTKKLIVN